MKKVIYTFVVLLIACTSSYSQQNVEFDKKNFKDRKKEFREAEDQLEEGNEYYNGENHYYGLPQYNEAIPFFEKANEFNPNNATLNFRLGICYLHSNHKYKSLDYLLKAYKLKNTVHPKIHYHIGEAYQLQYEWDKAIQHFEYYRKTLNQKDDVEAIFDVNKRIAECNTGKELVANPIRVWIDNLGENINSPYPEYAPVIATDESVIMFTARRPDTQGGDKDPGDNMYFEDIYISRKENGEWTKAENMGDKINSKGHDATAGVSPNGNILYVYHNTSRNGGDIYQSDYKHGEWTKIDELGKNINDKDSHESSAVLSYDGKKLYFISDKEGGYGGHDIYVSDWDEDKERWGPAENVGPVVNTKYDESGVFIHPDGKTMYFSSNGHKTMGSYDIFYTVFEDGVWSQPKNIGYPVNTPDADVHFVVSASGRRGYFASFHEDGYGEKDLYMVTFLGPEKLPVLNNEDNLLAMVAKPVKEKVIEPKVEVIKKNLSILKGIIRDAKTLEPLEARLELIDNETNELVAEFSSDASSGKYLVSLPSGKNYGIAVKKEDYLFHSENFVIPEAAGYREYTKNIDLKKVEIGESIVLRNIFFDLDKATLRPESKTELERLIKLMNDNPTLKIEISGHTDSRGSDSYNQDLSERRAESVVNYLVEHGIDKNRLEFAGYGEAKPIVPHEDIAAVKDRDEREELHQQNRRTEFKILSK